MNRNASLDCRAADLRKHAYRALGLSASLAALGVAPALAQTAVAQKSDKVANVEEIIVTANKREQSILQVPSAVTAVTGLALERQNLVSLEDFASKVPGFALLPTGGGRETLIIRGENTGGGAATVATMIDEVVTTSASSIAPSSRNTANIDTFDLERVEVLRGPQGTLYGASSEGGLLKYVTKKPDLTAFSGKAQGGFETIDGGGTGYSVRGVVNIPILKDVVALRVNGTYQETPGYIDNPGAGEKTADQADIYSIRGSLLIHPTQALTIRLTGARQHRESDALGVVDVIGASPNKETSASFNPLGGSKYTHSTATKELFLSSYDSYNATINYDLGIADLTSSTSYARTGANEHNDITTAAAGPGITVGQLFGNFYGQKIDVLGSQQTEHKKVDQELRLASSREQSLFSVPFDWQVGVFYTSETIVFNQYYDARPVTNLSVILTKPLPFGGSYLPATFEEYSGFADFTFHITSRFDFGFGGRYSSNNQWSQVTNDAGFVGSGGPAPRTFAAVTTSESVFTYSIAPRFKLNEDNNLYARVASGYRPGGPIWPIPGAPPGFPRSTISDTTTNYELGAKGTVLDSRLSYDIALYHIDWTDVQITSIYISPVNGQQYSVSGNAGSASSQGVEWALYYDLAKGLKASTTGSYTDAKLTKDAPGIGGKNNDALPYVPKIQATINLDYSWDLTSSTVATIGGSFVHTADRYSALTSSALATDHTKLPDYDTVDLRAGLDFGRYQLDFFARNLSNERGITSYANSGGGVLGSGTGYFIQPRTYGFRVTAAF